MRSGAFHLTCEEVHVAPDVVMGMFLLLNTLLMFISLLMFMCFVL